MKAQSVIAPIYSRFVDELVAAGCITLPGHADARLRGRARAAARNDMAARLAVTMCHKNVVGIRESNALDARIGVPADASFDCFFAAITEYIGAQLGIQPEALRREMDGLPA